MRRIPLLPDLYQKAGFWIQPQKRKKTTLLLLFYAFFIISPLYPKVYILKHFLPVFLFFILVITWQVIYSAPDSFPDCTPCVTFSSHSFRPKVSPDYETAPLRHIQMPRAAHATRGIATHHIADTVSKRRPPPLPWKQRGNLQSQYQNISSRAEGSISHLSPERHISTVQSS